MIVTFVCTANICRSAYAQVLAQHMLATREGDGTAVHSAGTWARTGQAMCPEMAAQAEQRGASTAGFRARRLDRELVERSDLLLTAEAAHRLFILDEWPRAFRRVVTLHQFAGAIADADADAGWPELLAHARARRATTTADVSDPYGRGPAAAAGCAAELDHLLEVILPRITSHPAG